MARSSTVKAPAGEAPAPMPPPAPMPEPGRETLEELAAEAAGEAAGEAAAIADAAPPPPPVAEASLELRGGCVGLVTMLGGILCARAGVKPLSAEEAEGLGAAIAGVAAIYLPADMIDPITARWLALGGAALAVVLPRLAEAGMSAPKPANDRPVVPAPRAYGGEPLPPGPLGA